MVDVWTIQREAMKHGDISFDSVESLPMIKNAIRCPECQGEDACDQDSKELEQRMGGNPWNPETFK